MHGEKLKSKIKNGEIVIGTYVKGSDPAIPEILSSCGFDFIIIDGEHSPLNINNYANHIRSADSMGLPVIVRIHENNKFYIMQALDIGASGIQVPQVNSAKEASEVVSAAKYFPEGSRGFATTHRAAKYGNMDPVEYITKANKNTLVICYVETREAVDDIWKTVKIEGIDVFYIGPSDLSHSYGVPGEVENQKVLNAANRVIKVCNTAKKTIGTVASNPKQVKDLVKRGFRFIVYNSDLGLMMQAGKYALKEIKTNL